MASAKYTVNQPAHFSLPDAAERPGSSVRVEIHSLLTVTAETPRLEGTARRTFPAGFDGMASPRKRRKPEPGRKRNGRSAFRAEFYQNDDDAERRRIARARAEGQRKGRRRRIPLAVSLGAFGILLCIIGVGGSSAMIWLRKLGALFGVYWTGDF
jgi:hypothetical protein